MFDSIFNPISLPPYSSLKTHEGKGNFAVSKYYRLPFMFFYRKKLYMIRNLLDKRIYKNILDYGAGPGIFTKELKRHALSVVSVNEGDVIDKRARFDCVVCASSLEFIENLPLTLCKIYYRSCAEKAQIIVASPMQSALTKFYFKLIGDTKVRHSQEKILSEVDKWFEVKEYHEWFGLYFSLKGVRRD